MHSESPIPPPAKYYLSTTSIAILALATGFFSRLTMLVKIPPVINFLHFGTVPLAFGLALLKSRSKDPQQLAVSRKLLFAFLLVLATTFLSALLNDAGTINAILHFLLFNEPAMLLLAIVIIPMSRESVDQLRKYLLRFGFCNLILALIQRYVLQWHIRGRSVCHALDGVDTITGVFLCQGAGVIVSASVSLALVSHFLVTAKDRPLWLRIVVFFAAFAQMVEADAKQVMIVAAVAFALMSFANIKDVGKSLMIIIGTVVLWTVFWWAIFQFEFLSGFAGWVRPEIYGPDGEATQFKLFGINAILQRMNSPLQWLIGLGPGHTIDRLGMVMLKEYSKLLSPLGSTRTDLADGVWLKMGNSWLANGSTMFSPFFGWGALWGDLGWIGVSAYFYLYSLIWRLLCKDDLSKYHLLCVFVVGWIQAGLQEPGFTLFVASLIGLQWQELRLKRQEKLAAEARWEEEEAIV